jgi:phosphate/sulfate permease
MLKLSTSAGHQAACFSALAAVYAATIGVPSPEKRTMVSGVIAVLVVNVVSDTDIWHVLTSVRNLACKPTQTCTLFVMPQIVGAFIFTAFRDEDAEPVKEHRD